MLSRKKFFGNWCGGLVVMGFEGQPALKFTEETSRKKPYRRVHRPAEKRELSG